jgi:hypothetical protein
MRIAWVKRQKSKFDAQDPQSKRESGLHPPTLYAIIDLRSDEKSLVIIIQMIMNAPVPLNVVVLNMFEKETGGGSGKMRKFL